MQGVPINIDNLIHARSVEDNRREFKATWNDAVKESVVRSVCAFANDLLNLNGGYIILGIDTDEQGLPILPPRVSVISISIISKERYTDSVIALIPCTSHSYSPKHTAVRRY